ncbi:ABC transporter permease [Streptomyces spiroverticillatus]|uniref:ABC transporter permease n=1 Tax=Streptomyces finlayi TaxID=67296 RepID=A0A918X0U0_9ACTN|nr:iron chelate uptake ABC transporter family permease subunit [Streptomyces finlayi]GHA36433.1 ABC transporter permease [Streptomyces spiroverticillatus]GHD02016.1 ABC transporter permease [Streptomyces finlayi]
MDLHKADKSPAAKTDARKGARALRVGGVSVRYDVRAVVLTLLMGLVALAVAVLLVLVGGGDFPMSPGDVFQTLLGNGAMAQEFIVLDVRLPRVLTALLVGAALGLSGAVFQSVSRNPLGSPDMLGFSQGAMVGALLMIVVFRGNTWTIAAGALVGCLITGVLVYLLAWKRGVHGYRLVLVGIAASAMLTAVLQYLLTKANLADATEAMVWLTGSLDGRGWEQVWPMAAACVVLVPLILRHGRSLRMMEMGDDAAFALGVPVERVRVALIVLAVLLMGAATAAAGPIIFVSLSAPQVARRLTRAPGPNLVASALMGSALLIVADWAAQSAFGERQLPVGVVTGVVGGCYLLWLLVTERKAGRL